MDQRWKLSGAIGSSRTRVHSDNSCDKQVVYILIPSRTLNVKKAVLSFRNLQPLMASNPSPDNHTIYVSLIHQNLQIPKSQGNLQEPEDPDRGAAPPSGLQIKLSQSSSEEWRNLTLWDRTAGVEESRWKWINLKTDRSLKLPFRFIKSIAS